MAAIPLLTIVLPCYNPLAGWQAIIARNLQTIKGNITGLELIIVNDGSTINFDETPVREFFSAYPEVKIISYPVNRGKGHALREGVGKAQGELIIYTDIDFPYTQESFDKIYSSLIAGNTNVVIGIRDEGYYMHLPASRKRISKLLRFFIKKFLRIPTDDTQCGLKGCNQKGKEVFLQTSINRYLFDLEFIFIAARKNLNIKTVPVELRPDVYLSKMNWKILISEFFNFVRIFLKGIL